MRTLLGCSNGVRESLRVAGLGLLLLWMFGGGIGYAQSPMSTAPPAATQESDEQRAEELVERGTQFRNNHQPAKALPAFLDAYRLYPSPALLWPIAELQAELHMPVEGLRTLGDYRKALPRNRVAEVTKLEHDLRAQLAGLRIVTDAPAILVRIDNQPQESASPQAVIWLNPGVHRFTVLSKATSELLVERELTLKSSVTTDLEARLPKRDAGGTNTGSGTAKTGATSGGGDNTTSTNGGPASKSGPAGALLGLAAASLVATIVVGAVSAAQKQQIDSRCQITDQGVPVCFAYGMQSLQDLQSLISSQSQSQIAAGVLAGVTVVSLAIGIPLLVRERRAKAASGIRATWQGGTVQPGWAR